MGIAFRIDARAGSLLALLFVAGVASNAGAQDVVTAEALFRQGRELVQAGKYKEGCEKLAASQRIDPSSGTMINLADCHLRDNKTASAWAEFLTAARLARAQNNPDRVAEATKRAADLEKNLAYVTFNFASKAPGTQVSRDDTPIDDAALSGKIPFDQGPHVIAVKAAGYEPWTTTIQVGAGESTQVAVPALKQSAAPPPSASAPATAASGAPPPPTVPHSSTRTTIAYVSGGVGVVGVVLGSVFGLKAGSTYKTADNACPSHVGCTNDTLDTRKKAGTYATISDIGFGVGIIGLGVGVALLLTAPSQKETASRSWQIAPSVGPNGAGASIAWRLP